MEDGVGILSCFVTSTVGMGPDIVRTPRAGSPKADFPPEKHPDRPDRPASAVPNQADLSCGRVADNTKSRKTHALRLLGFSKEIAVPIQRGAIRTNHFLIVVRDYLVACPFILHRLGLCFNLEKPYKQSSTNGLLRKADRRPSPTAFADSGRFDPLLLSSRADRPENPSFPARARGWAAP